tara:strand:+ start:78 stop:419 length:342 start_codon:yes stop_codon:yes gene_type:complete
MTFCAPTNKAEYLTECLLEVVNNRWKVDAIESGRSFYHKLTYKVGRKYIKVMDSTVGIKNQSNGVFMFVDKETGACYKPASWAAPAKGIRFYIESLVETPEVVDPYGSFLYIR